MSPKTMIYKMAESPYPPSFQGSGWAYGLALFSLMLISLMGAYTVSVAVRNLICSKEERNYRHFIAAMAAFGASARCAAEVAYKMAWGEVSASTLSMLLTIKNTVDTLVVFPVVGWMFFYIVFISTLDTDKWKTARLSIAIAIIGVISAIFGFTKV
jgi:hypothetical protein